MFNLPKKLGESFGFIGNDPKLAFRTQPSGIARLADKTNIAETDDAYWSQVSLVYRTLRVTSRVLITGVVRPPLRQRVRRVHLDNTTR
jgi:hypothetical protein